MRRTALSWRYVTCLIVSTLLAALLGTSSPAAAAAKSAGAPSVPQAKSVAGVKPLSPRKIKVRDQAKGNYRAPASSWPKAATGSAIVAAPARGASKGVAAAVSGTPVWVRAVSPKSGSYQGPRSVSAHVLPRKDAAKLGVSGVVFTVGAGARTDGRGQVQVGLDYGTFAHAYGGNYAARLHLVKLPACALTTPQRTACRTQTPVTTTRDAAAQKVATTLTLDGTPASTPAFTKSDARTASLTSPSASTAADATTVLAVTAGADTEGGAAGNYGATSLAPSGSWSGGGSNGSFTYNYTVSGAASSGKLQPTVGLSYDSGSVDGATSATQAQASWAGDGWGTPDSYIEQTFTSCSDSPEGAASPVSSADSCYAGPILTLSLNGSSSSLIKNAAGDWTPQADNGEIVTHKTATGNGSGTYNADYWIVTERDGTQYMFGRNQLPGWSAGKATTNSVDSEPVYSAHSGDPCYDAAGFTSSVCTMAYRWHLDYVVDVHKNAMAYYYGQDTNYYGEDNGAHNVSYVRDSHLKRIDYGFRDGGAFGTVPDQVLFTTAPRCTLATCDALSSTNAASQYPDVPYDLNCASGTTCTVHAPSFYSTLRLKSITAQQWSVSASKYQAVDTYTLRQSEPPTGDGTAPALWLAGITHEGDDTTAGGSTALSLPEVTFTAISLPNRVDTSSFPGLYRNRISSITSETGGLTSVTYSLPSACTTTYVASADPKTNTKSCYPVSWTPKDYAAPITDWFEKYAVTQVLEQDPTGGAVAKETDYTYNGGAAWHHDDNELVKAKYRTWGQFRGYASVTTQTGDGANDPKTSATSAYYRGMDGDYLTSSTTRSVALTDSQGATHTDSDQLTGRTLESTTYKGAGGPVDHSTITSYWISAATATRTRTGLPALTAHSTATAETFERQAVTSGPATTWRNTETDTTYDATPTSATFGLPTAVYAHTVPADPTADRCTTTSYAKPNTSLNLVGLVDLQESDAVACSGFTQNTPASTPKTLNTLGAPSSVSRPAQVVSATESFYDDETFSTTFPQAAAPGDNLVTMVRKATGYSGGAFTWQTQNRSTYDDYGRITATFDANNNKTTTDYTLDTVGLTTGVTVTNAKKQANSTTLAPARGLALTATDANSVASTVHYDALGRTTDVWQHSRATTAPADAKYTYTVSKTGSSGTTTQKLNDSLGYVTSFTIVDSLGRARQTQAPTPQGGRMITESFYDSHGWVRKKNNAYWDPNANPTLTLVTGQDPKDPNQDSKIPNQEVDTFDGLGRAVIVDSFQYSELKEETTTVYNGDSTTVIPPDGGTVKTTRTDAIGRTTELDSYSTRPSVTKPANTFTGTFSVTGGTSTPITYGFDSRGQQNTTTAGGSTWTTTFDLLGHVVFKTDPDGGSTSEMLYDANGNLTQTKDARDKYLSYTYDALNRQSAKYASTLAAQVPGASGNQLAAWVFDNDNAVSGVTHAIGQTTTVTSYQGGNAYTTQQLNFNAFGESTGQTVTVPAALGALGGKSYTFKHNYSADTGLLYTDNYPLGGGLPNEIITHTYSTALDLANGLGSTSYGYAQNTTYTAYGQVGQETLGMGTNLAYLTNTYDPHTGSLKDQLVTRTTTPAKVDEQAYDYDKAGNVTRQVSTRLDATTATETQCYQYDGLDRLTQAWTATDACAATPTAASHATVGDPLAGGTAYWTSWDLNTLGQRKTQTDHSTTGGTDTTTNYAYDGNGKNQPHTLTSTQDSGASTGKTSATYDASGNTLTRNTVASGNQSLIWDDAGHLTQISGGKTGTTSYVYNADGSVLAQIDPASTTLYLPGEQLTLTGTATTGVRYLPLPGGGTAVRTGTGTNYKFEIADPHGTSSLFLDNTCQTPTWRQFTPYGGARGAEVSWLDNRGFLNAPTNTNSGLTLLGARQYDPTQGVFISLDPVFEQGSLQELNGYSYSGANPTSTSDPTGLAQMCGEGGGACYADDWNNDGSHNRDSDRSTTGSSECHHDPDCLRGSVGSASTGSSGKSGTHNSGGKSCSWHSRCGLGKAWGSTTDWVSENRAAIAQTVTEVAVGAACYGAAGAGAVETGGASLALAAGCGAIAGAAGSAVSNALTPDADHSTTGALKDMTAGAINGAASGVLGAQAGELGALLGCGKLSFSPTTPVLMAGGATKAIAKIRPGDKVEAADPETGRHKGPRTVTATWINHDNDLIDLTIRDKNGHTSTLHTTSKHPFWDDTTHTWVPAAKLPPGHALNTATDDHVSVATVRIAPGAADMHNLTVDQLHTYYVLAAGASVLVHNCGGSMGGHDPSCTCASGGTPVGPVNARLAGGVHPKTGVPFKSNGYPDFSNWRDPNTPDVYIALTGNRPKDFALADKAAGINAAYRRSKWTWNHSEDCGFMELVDMAVHAGTGHTGGFSIC
ncbi:polymorphic toxin-type HINT domain-containing protein [Streptomyces sp. NPDC050738]|uniref:polymorphic toxin-type HINT domain-containing protein n=1 Tax=Streptomyces sp. NPDC050738 TaxID=3154744 RepID=UPI0034211F81